MKKKICAWMCFLFSVLVFAGGSVKAKDTLVEVTPGVVISASDDCLYKFEMEEQGYFEIKAQNPDRRWCYLYDESMNKIASWYPDDNGELTTPKLPFAKGVYYIKPDVYEGQYTLQVNVTKSLEWECEWNNDVSKANVIQTGKVYNGYLNDNYDSADYYMVSTDKNGYFTVDLSMMDGEAPPTGGLGWDLYIYDKDNKEIWRCFDIKSKKTSAYIPCSKGENYYIKISINSNYTTMRNIIYKLLVSCTDAPTWEREDNGKRQNATKIEKGSNYFGTIKSSSDVDYYKIDLKSSGCFSVNFGTEVEQSFLLSTGGWKVEVLSPGDKILYTKNNVKEGFTTGLLGGEPGEYCIRISSSSSNMDYAVYNLSWTEPAQTGSFAEFEGYKFYKLPNDNIVCYSNDGTQVKNDFKCDGTYTYYFQADGTAMRDRLTYHPDGVHVIYFNQDGHEVFSDFAHVSRSISGDLVDDYCFFDVHGYMYVDVLTWNKEGDQLLYANPYGRLECAGWFQFSETVMWADGTACEGIASEPNNPRYGYGKRDCTLLRNKATYDWRGVPCFMQGNGVALY